MTKIRDRDERMYDAAESAFTSEGGFVAPAAQNSQRTALDTALVAPREMRFLQLAVQPPTQSEQFFQQARQRIMETASVTSDGRHYDYDGNRYDQLADAVHYYARFH